MKTAPLAIDLIRLDAGTQSRVAINDDTVEDYADILRAIKPTEWPFPPLDVFHDGSQYSMGDGFHRCLGAKRAGRSSVPCVVHKGTATDARIFSMTANDRHGMRMTRADKRSCVEWLLDNKRTLTQKEIAVIAGVGRTLVQTVVAERKPKIIPQQPPLVATKARNGNSPPQNTEPDPFDDGTEPPDSEEDETEDAPESTKPTDKCPNCAGERWKQDEDGWACAKCHHPHGEPAGDVDGKQVALQRSKTVKTVEALMRAFDDLQLLVPKEIHEATITCCKGLLATAKGWK